jgi:hypothetical protein
MKRTRNPFALYASISASALAASVLLVACGPQDGSPLPGDKTAAAEAQPPQSTATRTAATPRATAPTAPRPAVMPGEPGRVTAVVPIEGRAPTTGAGAVIGGLVGGVLGNQVGGGSGKAAATVVGVVGGAAAGQAIEKERNTRIVGYRIDVQLDDGRTKSFQVAQAGSFATGQRVRVVDGALQPA